MIFSFDETQQFVLGPLMFSGIGAGVAWVLLAGCVAAAFWAISRLAKCVLFPHLVRRTAGTHLRAVHILLTGFQRVIGPFFWMAGLYLAFCLLPWTEKANITVQPWLDKAWQIVCLALLARGLWNCAGLCRLILGSAAKHLDLNANRTIVAVLEKGYRVLVVVFCVIAGMDVLGYPVTGLITGVGLAGLTFSLAAQDSASNLFSGLMILLERPFEIGDWIKVGDVEGTVEDLTFRSTKVRALDHSLYVLPNASVASATVNNGTKRDKRMFRFTLGVTYDTPRAKIETLMQKLEALLKAQSDVEADSVLVRLTGFGDSSIDILVSCYVLTPDIGVFLAAQSRMNLDILDLMNGEGVSFAFPSTSIYVEKSPAPMAKQKK